MKSVLKKKRKAMMGRICRKGRFFSVFTSTVLKAHDIHYRIMHKFRLIQSPVAATDASHVNPGHHRVKQIIMIHVLR